MKILNLIIKHQSFDAIMAGRKVQELRKIRPTTIKKLLQLDEEGYEVEDEYGNAQPIKYDAIRFFVGYNKDRDSALVEVERAYCENFVDDDDKPIVYESGVDKDGNPLEWIAEQVVFNLGRILEKDIRDKSKR